MNLILKTSLVAEETSGASTRPRIGAESMGVSASQLERKEVTSFDQLTNTLQDFVETTTSTEPAALIFAVVGIGWGDIAAGPDCYPHNRLADALKKQIVRVTFRHTGMQQAVVYGDDGTDIETRQALRKSYRPHGRFGEFAFFNDAALAACGQFGIELKILETTEALPARRIILVQEPYFPGV